MLGIITVPSSIRDTISNDQLKLFAERMPVFFDVVRRVHAVQIFELLPKIPYIMSTYLKGYRIHICIGA